MKPAIGRIVHVLVDPGINNGSDVAPAIITRVWSDTCVNLRVLHDGPVIAPQQQYRPEWLTSWSLHESREALEAHAAERQAAERQAALDADRAPGVEPAKVLMFGAFWPPRVEHQPGDGPARF